MTLERRYLQNSPYVRSLMLLDLTFYITERVCGQPILPNSPSLNSPGPDLQEWVPDTQQLRLGLQWKRVKTW